MKADCNHTTVQKPIQSTGCKLQYLRNESFIYEASYLLTQLEASAVAPAVLMLILVVEPPGLTVLVDYSAVQTSDVVQSPPLHCSLQAATTVHTLLQLI